MAAFPPSPPPNEPPPPGGGFGSPYGPQPPFVPPPPPSPGNMTLGFLAGFFGGCLGWLLVLAFAKGPETKKGAGLGLACQVVVGFVWRAITRNHH